MLCCWRAVHANRARWEPRPWTTSGELSHPSGSAPEPSTVGPAGTALCPRLSLMTSAAPVGYLLPTNTARGEQSPRTTSHELSLIHPAMPHSGVTKAPRSPVGYLLPTNTARVE
ncbi:hypothetical protein NDU88_006883 [Pleurodeles waltl]|uniref:Uncharacterized protein n=1 Tax=Pleurodeles waltl TaxID=8319 RepID=A0AAV7LQX8_PLEWA|nr:hypothetical protein NDU88_006883 [Pleurodeles waltl]